MEEGEAVKDYFLNLTDHQNKVIVHILYIFNIFALQISTLILIYSMQDRAKIGTESNSTGVPEIIYNVTKVLFSHTKTWQAVNNWCLAQPYRKPLA